ncbi:MAG: class I SAM-dependent methyltransferase [Bacteroidetes bacterium]|nr:class I SAM-dependent methyltransferase [Bacteroidota bacterium]
MKNVEWFANWFDTPYYHILYKHRDYSEAESFINKLLEYLKIDKKAKILDLACGKGRHAYFIAQKAFEVWGLDLSEQSIAWAKENYHLNNLHFDVHDMRELYTKEKFDYVFNFFTSFGYFSNSEENQAVIHAMQKSLKKDGTIVLDYLNTEFALRQLVKEEEKLVDGIHFTIEKRLEKEFIVKNISFEDKGKKFNFEERVHALSLADFQSFFKSANLELVQIFGSYNLESFDVDKSERLIMIVKHANGPTT